MKTEEEVKQIISDHWRYVDEMLVAHDVPLKERRIAMFHYRTAMQHGWKHAKEDSGESVFAPEWAEQTTVDGTKVVGVFPQG